MGANREMSDVDDRLRALDPFAGAPYVHADAAAMVERISTGTTARPRRRRLAVLLGPLAVASVAGLATVGALLSAASPAPQLLGLSLAGSAAQASNTARASAEHASAAYGEPLRLYADALDGKNNGFAQVATPSGLLRVTTLRPLFALGTQLSVTAPSLDAYAAIPPANPAGVLAAGAARLGLRGPVTRAATATWRLDRDADSRQAAELSRVEGGGLLLFRYVRSDVAATPSRCAPSSPSGAVDTDRLAMTTTLTGLLRSLSVGYSLGPATYSTSWSGLARATCRGTVLETAPVVVGGVATDLSVQVAFDSVGTVLDASAPVFTTGRSAAYPLVSPARAAASLVSSSSAISFRAAGSKSWREQSATSTNGAALVPDLVVVELHPPTVGLDAFATTSGTTWLLPVYAFTGDGFAQHAASPTEWSGDVLAAAAPLVRVVGSHDNQANVFRLREVVVAP